MTDNRVERRLAAILAADVAGYSRLTGLDEEGTHVRLRERLRGLADPKISEHRGKVVKHTGDGVLAEFGSVVDAVRCAIEVQRGMAEQNATMPQVKRIEFRIGIHVGDIIVDDNDIFGDGVNIAARLEGIAEPGGVCISDDAQRQVRGKVDFAFEDMGAQNLKNIVEPMRAWRLRMNASGSPAAMIEPPVESTQALALPDKPSIAVLPFQNMSGDPEQEYFADGMVEEIITALSRFKWLFVIARNSSFTFKGKAVDVKEVGRRLGVRYVLEGSVRKATGRVRITGQLIDAVTGAHIWADRFERDMADVFALQDEVTVAVVSAIQPKLFQTEIAMATRRRPENLTAYDFFLRAMQQYLPIDPRRVGRGDQAGSSRFGAGPAVRLCHGSGRCLSHAKVLFGYAVDPQFDRKEAVRLLRLALSIDDGDPDTIAMAAIISAFMVGDCEREIEMANRAVALNPNSFLTWSSRGHVFRIAGLPEEAIRSFERAIRMSPVDPQLQLIFVGMGMAFIELRRFDEAIVAGKKAHRQTPSFPPAYFLSRVRFRSSRTRR